MEPDKALLVPENNSPYLAPVLAGAIAGFSVDVTLYPLDTIKTRLQSAQGFQKAGGFRGIYKGLAVVASTSVPTSALFFVSYETTKRLAQPFASPAFAPLVHMLAASVGEVLACLIRVPSELAKQRKQTYVGTQRKSNISILVDAYKAEGLRKGLYRGFQSTVIRDLPFSFIELPLWEMLKTCVKKRNDGNITGLQSAMCGSIAGGVAAYATTPLDLAKTRIMLAEGTLITKNLKIRPILTSIYLENGIRGLFAGAIPRFTAFFIGGFVYFGAYDYSKAYFESVS